VDAQLARISTLADTSPALVHEAIADLRSSLNSSSDRLDTAWLEMLRTLHSEREALAANIASERANITQSVDDERAKVSADAADIAARAVDSSWIELRKLVREALLLLTLLSAVLLGLPFAAGYLVGRRRRSQQSG
jgi:predicted phage gp36 major capsid-like protein